MKLELNSDNRFFVRGHISKLNLYAGGKAMNITVAVHRDDSDNDIFITMKSFTPAQFEHLTVGMAVEIYGEIGPASYKNKEGETVYKDNNDLIAKYIRYDETKHETMHRKLLEAMK